MVLFVVVLISHVVIVDLMPRHFICLLKKKQDYDFINLHAFTVNASMKERVASQRNTCFSRLKSERSEQKILNTLNTL